MKLRSRLASIVAAAALACGLAAAPAPADALSSSTPWQKAELFGGNPNVLIPSLTLNFTAGAYGGLCPTLAACLGASRSFGGATDLTYDAPAGASYTTYAANTLRIRAGRGLLVEDDRINYLVNSASPATQTTATLPNGKMWLWVNGPGSATLSNGTASGCIGTATQGFPAMFTTAGNGSCVVTVSGSLNEFQLEGYGYQPTSFIATAGSPVDRGTETVTAIGPLAAIMKASAGFDVVAAEGYVATNQIYLERYAGHNTFSYVSNPSTTVCALANSTAGCTSPLIENDATLFGSGGTALTRVKIATAWGPNGVSLAWNDGPVVTIPKPFSTTATNLYIGSYGTTYSANYFIQSIVVGSYAPSNAALRSGTNAWSPTFERYVGDSLTLGEHSTNPYANQLVALLPGGAAAYPLVNLGITGETAATMAANWATAAAPIHDPTIPKCVDFIWAGTNDIAGGTETNAQIEGYLSSLWASSISQGCLPVAFTILPRSGGLIVSAGTFETDRQAINTWIRAQSASYAALVDVGADATIGQAGDESNATYYYSDGTHLLAAGDAIVAADALIALENSGVLP